MKKILIDIDVLTIGLWEKSDPRKDIALQFLKRVENGEFFVYFLDEHLKAVSEWKHGPLKDRIIKKITDMQNQFVELSDVFPILEEKTRKNSEEFATELTKFSRSKKADILLVLACSILEIEYLVTFNRKHLRSRRESIEEFLRRHGMYAPKIVLPSEI